jgi:hypothetical protein
VSFVQPRIPPWKFILADATTSPPTALGELFGAHNKHLTLALNKSGSFSFDMSMRRRMAALIQPITTCIIAYKHAQPMWSGPVWTIDEKLPEGSMSVNAVGWFELLNNRILRDAVSYSNTVGGTIALNLLNIINGIGATRITSDATQVHDTQTRSRDYTRWQNLGAAITELSEIENGFDFMIDPLTRVMSFWPSPTLGGPNSPTPLWHDRTNVVFGYRFGPDNVASFGRNTDASQTMNTIFVSGKNATYGPGSDAASVAAFGIFEEQVALSDIADVNVLTAFGAAEVTLRRTPRVIYSVTPFPATSSKRAPDPLFDYGIGDQVYLTAYYPPRVSIQNQAVRVFGMDITIDDNGNETLGPLQVSP